MAEVRIPYKPGVPASSVRIENAAPPVPAPDPCGAFHEGMMPRVFCSLGAGHSPQSNHKGPHPDGNATIEWGFTTFTLDDVGKRSE